MPRELAERGWMALVDELENFQDIAKFLKPAPGSVPALDGVDIHGESMPLNGIVGGDHILYIDYRTRYDLDARIAQAQAAGHAKIVEQLRLNKQRAGILVADVAGHRITDALLVAMLHQAFLLGSYYELDRYGTITPRILENINARFHESTTVRKYLTAMYGEISVEGKFRFISAGHPAPVVFSREFGRIMRISDDRTISYPPIGVLRSGDDVDARLTGDLFRYKKRYTVNEINLLGDGDILILLTDGLTEHARGQYFPAGLERCLSEARDLPSWGIAERIRDSLLAFAPPEDDISFVVIKKKV
ncbi:MAG: serine/threonine-protein phosphatase [Acidobacteriia bacterium]|nr:serine/threonine-protein phosphatase [Terriglobia bacterium]